MALIEVEVEVDIESHLDEVATGALQREVNRRLAKGGTKSSDYPNGVEPWTHTGLAHDIRTAFYARNASRLEMLLMEIERHEEPAH